jgi:ABC-2 type transport system permease protein
MVLLQPLMWLLVFGVGIRRGLGVTVQGFDYIHYILPGIMGMNLLTAATRGGTSILRDKEWGFLKEVLVAPVSRVSILLGIGLGVVTRSAIQSFLLLLAGLALGITFGSGLDAVVAIVLAFALLFILGMALVSLTVALAWRLDDLPTYSSVSNAVTLPLVLLSGSLFPVKNLPDWLAFPIQLNPLTYGIDGIRQALLGSAAGHFELWLDVLVLAAFLLVTVAFATTVMRRSAN